MTDAAPDPAAPLVSVIIPTATAPERFPLSLASVLNQTVRDFEVIVVDDDSGADVQAVLDRFNDPRVRLIRHEVRRGDLPQFVSESNQFGLWVNPTDSGTFGRLW